MEKKMENEMESREYMGILAYIQGLRMSSRAAGKRLVYVLDHLTSMQYGFVFRV